MFKKILFAALLASASFYSGIAQDTTRPLSITAYVDAYYRFNLQNPKSPVTNNLTSFTNSQNSFELGMASVKLEHNAAKVGFVADLGVGRRAEEFSYNDSKTMAIIKQAYVTYAPAEKIKFSAGSWATHIGYELVDPALNRNYSMSYMFSYGPFFHTGVKVDLATKGKSAFMIGLANPTDLKSANFGRKFLIAQYATATTNDKYKLYLNYQGGTYLDRLSKIQQVDVVMTGALTEKFSLGYNGTIQFKKARTVRGSKYDDTQNWWGSALYFNYDPTTNLGLTLRTEYVSDKEGLIFGLDNVFATTLSANFKVGPLTIIPEFRVDAAEKETFINEKGNTQKSTSTALVAVVYQFKK